MSNQSKRLTLAYDCEPDKYGCINGIELAGQMMAYAARLLAPYVNNCPGCIDNLFSIVAEKSLIGVHQKLSEGYEFTEMMRLPTDEHNDEERQAAHVTAMMPLVKDLLQEARERFGDHDHHQNDHPGWNIPS